MQYKQIVPVYVSSVRNDRNPAHLHIPTIDN